ncbi:unnamed protein product [Polarella glacialis]|uniref:Uncharacterized protein n=1 Tax=Polarella glacialis TaxID=89957 RepID=A0A813J6A5_POLGL|nr:unnamed protein product [Polarella glacialis]
MGCLHHRLALVAALVISSFRPSTLLLVCWMTAVFMSALPNLSEAGLQQQQQQQQQQQHQQQQSAELGEGLQSATRRADRARHAPCEAFGTVFLSLNRFPLKLKQNVEPWPSPELCKLRRGLRHGRSRANCGKPLHSASKTKSALHGKRIWDDSLIGYFEDASLGARVDINVALSKDPQAPGLVVRFWLQKAAMGYALLEVKLSILSLRGIHISEQFRGRGLSKMFIAVWLALCFKLDVLPATAKMDKPLISLGLQQFGFVPTRGTFSLEVSPGVGADSAETVLWSEDLPRLRTKFSKLYLKHQRMVIASERPPRGRTVFVNTAFEAQDLEVIREYTLKVSDGAKLQLDELGLRSYLKKHAARMPNLLANRTESSTEMAGHDFISKVPGRFSRLWAFIRSLGARAGNHLVHFKTWQINSSNADTDAISFIEESRCCRALVMAQATLPRL